MTQLILYTSEDGQAQVHLRAYRGKVWLSQMMAVLFNSLKQNISLHLKNLFEDGELDAAATVKKSLTVQTKLTQTATTGKYSLVQMRAIQRCEVSGIAIGKTVSATA